MTIDMTKLITADMKHADALAGIWEKIKAERDLRGNGGGKVEIATGVFKWFHSDSKSITQHLANVRKADIHIASGGSPGGILTVSVDGIIKSIDWKTMDSTWVPLTARIAQDVVVAIESMVAKCYGVAEYHNTMMRASVDPANYDYSTGWPEHFVEVI